MRCASCGTGFEGPYGTACPSCGAISQHPFEREGEAPKEPVTQSPWQSPAAPGADPSGASGEPHSGSGIPWENERSFDSLLKTIKGVLLETNYTFTNASPSASLGPAFMFALILGLTGGLVGIGWNALTGMGDASDLPEQFQAFAFLMKPGISSVVMLPIQLIIGLFLWGGIVHLCLMMFGAADSGFEATFRVIAFAAGSTALLQFVPVMGPMIGGIWALVIEILGLAAIHRTTGGKAAAGVLLPLGVCCCSIGGIVAVAVGGAMSALK